MVGDTVQGNRVLPPAVDSCDECDALFALPHSCSLLDMHFEKTEPILGSQAIHFELGRIGLMGFSCLPVVLTL